MNELECSICGKKRKVFFDAIFDSKSKKYTIAPICIDCKSSDLSINELIGWEHELKNLEVQISKQLIADYFPKIKFKKFAEKKLTDLMKKYSIRTVFEVCTLFDGDFNIRKIEDKCKLKK